VSEQGRHEQAVACYRQLLHSIDGEDAGREGLRDTPARAAAALTELTRGYEVDIAGLFTTFEAEGYDEMVVMRNVPFFSLCEHHLLPFQGTAALAYIPDGRIVGLSKLARLVDAFARRLQVQERLVTQIADALVEHLAPKGVMVIVEAEHLCMAMRGVEVSDVPTNTSAVRGAMKTKPEARAEALALLTKGAP
jgi:GTP cyclohydrolase I